MASFWNLKYRFILAGCIVTIIGVIVLYIKHNIGVLLIVIGIIVLVIGLIWKFKPKVKPETNSTN